MNPLWVRIGAAVVGAALFLYFLPDILSAIGWVAEQIWELLKLIGRGIAYLGGALWTLLTTAAGLVLTALQWIVAVALAGVAVVVAFACITIPATYLARLFVGELDKVAKSVGQLRQDINKSFAELQEGTRDAAKEATFLGLVGVLSALVAYMGTEDFLDNISIVRFLAMGAIGLVIAKIFLLFRSRVARLCAFGLTVAIVCGAIAFVFHRYDVVHDAGHGFEILREAFADRENIPKLLLLFFIAVLFLVTALFPFSWSKWRDLILLRDNQKKEPAPRQS